MIPHCSPNNILSIYSTNSFFHSFLGFFKCNCTCSTSQVALPWDSTGLIPHSYCVNYLWLYPVRRLHWIYLERACSLHGKGVVKGWVHTYTRMLTSSLSRTTRTYRHRAPGARCYICDNAWHIFTTVPRLSSASNSYNDVKDWAFKYLFNFCQSSAVFCQMTKL